MNLDHNKSQNDERIIQNWDKYITERKDDISTPNRILSMLGSQSAFNEFIGTLQEGLTKEQSKYLLPLYESQRKMILEDTATSYGPNSIAMGYAVQAFPILTSIYTEPVLSAVATIHTTGVPIFTIPRVDYEATIKDFDGVTRKYKFPTQVNLVRSRGEEMTLLPNVQNDLFATSVGLIATRENAKINKTQFYVKEVTVSDGTNSVVEKVVINPDARNSFKHVFEFEDKNNETVEVTLYGTVDFEKGYVTYSTTFKNLAGNNTLTYSVTNIKANVRFQAFKSNYGRSKVTMKMSGIDIDVGVNEDFEIELNVEQLQDHRDLYNIEMFKSLSYAIKNQFMMNKDNDIASILERYEPEYLANGTFATVDLHEFEMKGGIGDMQPSNYLHVFQNIVPKIKKVTTMVQRNFHAEPQYLLTGMDTWTILSSMQETNIKLANTYDGEIGDNASVISFKRQKILYSPAIPNDTIYIIYKTSDSDLSRIVLMDCVYKGMYITEEIVNGVKTTFVRSRSMVKLINPTAVGCIKLKNFEKFTGVDSGLLP